MVGEDTEIGAGAKTVENMGLGGVTVRLSGMAEAQTATGDNGQYRLPASGQAP